MTRLADRLEAHVATIETGDRPAIMALLGELELTKADVQKQVLEATRRHREGGTIDADWLARARSTLALCGRLRARAELRLHTLRCLRADEHHARLEQEIARKKARDAQDRRRARRFIRVVKAEVPDETYRGWWTKALEQGA